jgi:OHCU decarboxylase
VITLAALNALPAASFTETLGAIFEHSPWVAQRAAASRPFASRLDLLDAMRTAVRDASIEDQLNLIRAHPHLGARGRKRLELTEASSREQRRAGLDACSDAEFAELMQLNAAYVQKFDFPFILAVRGHDPESILAFMRTRLNNNLEQERHTALTQIGLIGGYRLADLVVSSPAAEVQAMDDRVRAFRTDSGVSTGAAGPTGAGVPTAADVTARASVSVGTTTDSPTEALLLREWMLAAGLDIHAGVGFTPAASPADYFLFGAYLDTTTLRRDGSLSSLLGVALAQSLRVQQHPLRLGLLVSPFPTDGQQGSILLDAASGPLRDHTALAAADIDFLIPVSATGITERCIVVSLPAPNALAASSAILDLSVSDPPTAPTATLDIGVLSAPASPSAPLNLVTLERTQSALESFLTQPR